MTSFGVVLHGDFRSQDIDNKIAMILVRQTLLSQARAARIATLHLRAAIARLGQACNGIGPGYTGPVRSAGPAAVHAAAQCACARLAWEQERRRRCTERSNCWQEGAYDAVFLFVGPRRRRSSPCRAARRRALFMTMCGGPRGTCDRKKKRYAVLHGRTMARLGPRCVGDGDCAP